MLKTERETKVGQAIIRLLRHGGVFKGVVILDDEIRAREEGSDGDEVWRSLHDAAARFNPSYVGFDGARNRFLRFFPNGFHSNGFEAKERAYKLAAKAKLDASAPLEEAILSAGLGEAVLSVFRATNLLSPFEQTRLQGLLRGPTADAFIQAAASFTIGETRSALVEMESLLRPHDNAKWTVVSYLPFLWRPAEHMFLKPEVTKDFASRVGHRFTHEYEPRLVPSVYESLLDLVAATEAEITSLRPRDRIDIQSFVWVVGGYTESEEAAR